MLNALPEIKIDNVQGDKLEMIRERLINMRSTMDPISYGLFFAKWSIKSFEFDPKNNELTVEKAINMIKNKNYGYSDKKINNLLIDCMKPTKGERNMFIVFHLFAFARMLIRQSIEAHSHLFKVENVMGKLCHYDYLLYFNWKMKIQQNLEGDQVRMKISILSYIRAYDELEIKANNVMETLKKSNVINGKDILFEYKNKEHSRENMLVTLQELENKEDLIYPATFINDEQTLFINISECNYSSLLFKHFAMIDNLTFDECKIIADKIGEPNSFYELYENLGNVFIQQKIEQLINPFLIIQIMDEIKNPQKRKYINDAEDGQKNSLQKREELITNISKNCKNAINEEDIIIVD